MTRARVFYNRPEFTIAEDDPQFLQFGKELDELLRKYQDYLVGYDLEELTDGASIYHCYDDYYKDSEAKIKEIYRMGEQS